MTDLPVQDHHRRTWITAEQGGNTSFVSCSKSVLFNDKDAVRPSPSRPSARPTCSNGWRYYPNSVRAKRTNDKLTARERPTVVTRNNRVARVVSKSSDQEWTPHARETKHSRKRMRCTNNPYTKAMSPVCSPVHLPAQNISHLQKAVAFIPSDDACPWISEHTAIFFIYQEHAAERATRRRGAEGTQAADHLLSYKKMFTAFSSQTT